VRHLGHRVGGGGGASCFAERRVRKKREYVLRTSSAVRQVLRGDRGKVEGGNKKLRNG